MEVVVDGAWASLLPDILLDIFRRLETTAVIRCAGACKPWRRIIISNASSLRPCPDRYNPNLLLGFFHHRWYQGVTDGSFPPPPVTISVTAVDTGICESLSSFILPASVGGIDLSLSYRILTSGDGFLLLGRGSNVDPDELCLCNPLSGDCTFLPAVAAPIMEECNYVLLTGYDLSPCSGSATTRDDDLMTVQVLAVAGSYILWTKEDRLAYQVFSGDDGTRVWGPVQRSEEVNKGLKMITYSDSTVVSRDAVVYFLAGPAGTLCRITSTVGLDVYTGRAWTTELPKQCQFYYYREKPYVLTTSSNGRLSLLQPLPNHNIQVWVLVGDDRWTVQHRIFIDVQSQIPHYPGECILDCNNYLNVICPRSGYLFIMLFNCQQLRIDLENRARPPVHCIGKRERDQYYPYEMDWSTYISKMKNF